MKISPTDYAGLKGEYEMSGMVSQAFELANTGVVEALRADGPLFKEAIREVRGQGHFRVPYLFTDAIVAAAFDPTLVSVIEAILGKDWVVWGPNIQQGTPNEADKWHVDLESWHWPSITVMVGLENCHDDNTTRCIPFTQHLDVLPWDMADNDDDTAVRKAAKKLDIRCTRIRRFQDFQPGSFYLFDAKCWHCGPDLSSFQEREMMILHYQRASEPRIPYMYDYEKRLWFDEPAIYLEGTDLTQEPSNVAAELHRSNRPARFRTDLYALPTGHQLGPV